MIKDIFLIDERSSFKKDEVKSRYGSSFTCFADIIPFFVCFVYYSAPINNINDKSKNSVIKIELLVTL